MPRHPKPDSVKKAQGTLQPCRVRAAAAKAPPVADFKLSETPPHCLTGEAKVAWQVAVRYAPEGWLTINDATVLERWARNYALYRKISKQLEDSKTQLVLSTENGGLQLNPLFNASIKIQQTLASCEKELGFSPASRARVRAREETSQTEENPFLMTDA